MLNYPNRLRLSREWKTRNMQHCAAYTARYRCKFKEFYYYNTLRASAKRRNIAFTLTFGEFLNIIRWYPYFFIRNIPNRLWYSIDRINNTLGYTGTNCQVLLKYENSQKSHEDVRRKMVESG